MALITAIRDGSNGHKHVNLRSKKTEYRVEMKETSVSKVSFG